MLQLVRALGKYLDNLAPGTQRNYSGVYREWERFIKDKIFKASEGDVLRWIGMQRERKGHASRLTGDRTLTSRHILFKLSVLRNAYDYLLKRRMIRHNPFAAADVSVRHVPTPKRPTEMVPFEKVQLLIESADDGTKDGLMRSVLLMVMFAGGLRLNEARNLNINDLCEDHSGALYLRLFNTKRHGYAEQVIPDWTRAKFFRLRDQRLSEGARVDDPFFVYYRNDVSRKQRVSTRSVGLYFREACDRVGLPKTVTPHSARTTAITRLLAKTKDYKRVQQFSRHSSVQMVEVYDRRYWGKQDAIARELDY